MFQVGQEVVCVDPGNPANPWHRANPLIKGRHYIILEMRPWKHATNGTSGIHVAIDRSGRLWHPESFRPLGFDPIEINKDTKLPRLKTEGDVVAEATRRLKLVGARTYYIGHDADGPWVEIKNIEPPGGWYGTSRNK